MSSSDQRKRKKSDPEDDYKTEQVARRAKLDTPRGQDCSCLSKGLPQHIREIIMSSETPSLKSILRAYQRGLLLAEVNDIYTLYAPSPIVIFPDTSEPADTADEIRSLYTFHLKREEGIFFSSLLTRSPKSKGKERPAGDTAAETPESGTEQRDVTPYIQINVEEVSPLAEDWAFARIDFNVTGLPDKRVWAWFLFRKLGLGTDDATGGWRIARSIFTVPASERKAGQASPSAPQYGPTKSSPSSGDQSRERGEVRMSGTEDPTPGKPTSPTMAKRQKAPPGRGRGAGK